jgi:hypothetical protein
MLKRPKMQLNADFACAARIARRDHQYGILSYGKAARGVRTETSEMDRVVQGKKP